jgi:hypothetical protein
MTEELVMRLREDARYGYGAACDWSDEERADYWAQQCRKARRNAAEAADAIERLTYDGIHTCHADCPRLPCVQRREIEGLRAEVERLRKALRACRRAVSAGRDEPRLNVREIVDEAIEEHQRHLTNELQAHKDALAQVKGSSYE